MDQQAVSELIKENHLRYISDAKPGISRKLSGKHRTYFSPDGKKISDEKEIERINKLVLPPARINVWISPIANGHLQATGLDTKGRKQYRYHPKWIAARSETKFGRMKEFGKALPAIRKAIKKDRNEKELSQQKVVATAVTIMDRTGIRVGNEIYEELYGSFGLTTLRNKHATIHGDKVTFQFVGKKGVKQNIELKSKKLAHIIKQCKDIPGLSLFEYYDESGDVKTISSDMINEYIKTIAGDEFTAKDFRTRHGSVCALKTLHEKMNDKEKISIPQVIDQVAKELGNTRAVSKKYYIHPVIFELHESDGLQKYFTKYCNCDDFDRYEKALSAIIEKL